MRPYRTFPPVGPICVLRSCCVSQQRAHLPTFSGISGDVRASFPQVRGRSHEGLQEQIFGLAGSSQLEVQISFLMQDIT